MKLNIANPATGAQKKIEIEDEHKLQFLWDKRMAEEVQGEHLGDEFKGYVFKITGGNDKEGFPMRQGVLVSKRVRLLLRRGMPCYKPKKKGERKRKSVRGCIVGPDIAVLSLVIVKRGTQDLPGLTDVEIPRRLGPKRVDKIRKMFNLTKEDDPRDYVVRRKVKTKTGNVIVKKPKIQRLVTSAIIHRRKALEKQAKNRRELSRQNRKNYFERLNKKGQSIKKAKQVIEKVMIKPTKNASIDKKGPQPNPSKKKPAAKTQQSTKPQQAAKSQQATKPQQAAKPQQSTKSQQQASKQPAKQQSTKQPAKKK